MVHGNPEHVESDNLKDLLTAVRDVLWLCDYYRGFEWAIDHLSTETRKALGIKDAANG
jgi:hypothetical protein